MKKYTNTIVVLLSLLISCDATLHACFGKRKKPKKFDQTIMMQDVSTETADDEKKVATPPPKEKYIPARTGSIYDTNYAPNSRRTCPNATSSKPNASPSDLVIIGLYGPLSYKLSRLNHKNAVISCALMQNTIAWNEWYKIKHVFCPNCSYQEEFHILNLDKKPNCPSTKKCAQQIQPLAATQTEKLLKTAHAVQKAHSGPGVLLTCKTCKKEELVMCAPVIKSLKINT